MNVDEAIEHYLSMKINGEIDAKSIRIELIRKHKFSQEDTDYIGREIADLELEKIDTNRRTIFGFLNHIGFSYFMLITTLVVVGISLTKYYFDYRKDPHSFIDRFDILPLIFISGAVLLFGKHFVRIKRSIKESKRRY